MSDPVEDFLAREKDGLAGLENEIPSAFDGKISEILFLRLIVWLLISRKFPALSSDSFGGNSNADGLNDGLDSYSGGEIDGGFKSWNRGGTDGVLWADLKDGGNQSWRHLTCFLCLHFCLSSFNPFSTFFNYVIRHGVEENGVNAALII